MRVVTSKSKNAESFYISKGYINNKGVSTSVIIKKLGTLKELLHEHGPTRDDVMAWAKEQAKIETEKYKKEKENKTVLIPFHADRQMDYHKQNFFEGGYLFLQAVYYELGMNKICRKIREKHNYKYDLNAILSDLIYTRILEPDSKRSSYKDAPYTTAKLHQRLIITYSPKYAAYQKNIREKQIERAKKMIETGNTKKQRKNPNDPARFIEKTSVTEDGEIAEKDIFELDLEKIAEEKKYDGLYAVCTDLLDDEMGDILRVSEGRWQIESCFQIMKTDFSARPVYIRNAERIKAHFLICFLALLIFRLLEKNWGKNIPAKKYWTL